MSPYCCVTGIWTSVTRGGGAGAVDASAVVTMGRAGPVGVMGTTRSPATAGGV